MTDVLVDQTTSGGQWNSLGVFDLVAGAGPVVTLTDDANGSVSADGIALRLWANDPGYGWVGNSGDSIPISRLPRRPALRSSPWRDLRGSSFPAFRIT